MIRAIISDVDGVMVGKQEGVNFPLPHPDVLAALHRVDASGVPIVLCTAKFRVAIESIVDQAHLASPFISDGGAQIIDGATRKLMQSTELPKDIVQEYLARDQLYSEVYTTAGYYVQRGADPDFTAKRTKLLQLEPILVDSLAVAAADQEVIKIITMADDEAGLPVAVAQAEYFGDRVHYITSYHPFILPKRPMVITAPNVSKQHASEFVAQELGVDFADILGIGDTAADWEFMQLCGYVAAVGDDKDLAELVKTTPQSYQARSVDDHGLLEVFEHFELETTA